MDLWKKMVWLHSLPKRILVSPNTEGPQEIPAPSYKIRKNFLAPQKNFSGWEVYTMENKDTKADYQEVVRAGEQKWWEMVEITLGIIFFVWDSYSIFLIYVGNFQVPPEKHHPHLKFQFPPKMPIWPKPLLYKPEKWLNLPFHHPGGCNLWLNPSGYVNVYFSL